MLLMLCFWAYFYGWYLSSFLCYLNFFYSNNITDPFSNFFLNFIVGSTYINCQIFDKYMIHVKLLKKISGVNWPHWFVCSSAHLLIISELVWVSPVSSSFGFTLLNCWRYPFRFLVPQFWTCVGKVMDLVSPEMED